MELNAFIMQIAHSKTTTWWWLQIQIERSHVHGAKTRERDLSASINDEWLMKFAIFATVPLSVGPKQKVHVSECKMNSNCIASTHHPSPSLQRISIASIDWKEMKMGHNEMVIEFLIHQICSPRPWLWFDEFVMDSRLRPLPRPSPFSYLPSALNI